MSVVSQVTMSVRRRSMASLPLVRPSISIAYAWLRNIFLVTSNNAPVVGVSPYPSCIPQGGLGTYAALDTVTGFSNHPKS